MYLALPPVRRETVGMRVNPLGFILCVIVLPEYPFGPLRETIEQTLGLD